MHQRNGAAHHERRCDLSAGRPLLLPEPEGKLQGGQRDRYGQRQRERNNSAVVDNYGRTAHASHADIVRGRDAAAHDHAAGDFLPDNHLRPADYE